MRRKTHKCPSLGFSPQLGLPALILSPVATHACNLSDSIIQVSLELRVEHPLFLEGRSPYLELLTRGCSNDLRFIILFENTDVNVTVPNE